MALISLGEMLQETRRRRVAAPMFDVSNNQMIRAAVETAEEEDSPVILAAVEADLAGAGLEAWAGAALRCAARAAVPVAVMLDHATGFEWCERCADAGFSGVMIDASMLPFEENVAATREVCRRIGRRGVGVEAELGHVGSGSSMRSGGEPGGDTVYTEPGRVAEFAERTGCDALAVSIGTAHGVYASAPRLRLFPPPGGRPLSRPLSGGPAPVPGPSRAYPRGSPAPPPLSGGPASASPPPPAAPPPPAG